MAQGSSGEDVLEQRLRLGDKAALAAVFAIHRDRLWRIVKFRMDSRLLGRVEPEDVLQEAYLASAQRIEHYARDGFASPFVWLRVVVQQTLIDVYRRHLGAQMRDAGRDVSLAAPAFSQTTSESMAVFLAASMTSPSQAAVRSEAAEIVRQAVESMDPIDREILAMRHFEELTNGEAAEALGIRAQAASIRYIRALRRLKSILSSVPGMLDDRTDAGS